MGRASAPAGEGGAGLHGSRARGAHRQCRTADSGPQTGVQAPSLTMPTPRALLRFVVHRLGLERYLAKPGDGRQQPVIAARVLLWAMVVGRVLRECSFLGVEQIVRAAGCRVLGLQRSFSNDALSYFVERLDPSTTRSRLPPAPRWSTWCAKPSAGKPSRIVVSSGWPWMGRGPGGASSPTATGVAPFTMASSRCSVITTKWWPSAW